MKATIIFAHPWHGSYNKAVLDEASQALEQGGHEITVIDLNKDGFNPVMTEADLAAYGQRKSADPMVEKYNAILNQTEMVVLIFPIWWYDMPAIMRGFFDKVMLRDTAYREDENGLYPLRQINHTLILTTSTIPTDLIVEKFGDPINGTIIKATFGFIGFNNAIWHNLDGMHYNSLDNRRRHLACIPGWINEAAG